MKTLFLITFLLGSMALPSFAQKVYKLNCDTTFSSLSAFPKLDPLNLANRLDKMKSFKLQDPREEIKAPNFIAENFNGIQTPSGSVQNQSRFDNMPCLKPGIIDRMPVWKPDSTVNYTIMIKKIK